MKAYINAGIFAGIKTGVQLGTQLNQINLAEFADGTYLLATEEGYVISEQDNINNYITEE